VNISVRQLKQELALDYCNALQSLKNNGPDVATSPVKRTFGRRPSLVKAKYIEPVKTTNDDFQGGNVAASQSNTNSDQAQEDEVDYGYGV
jgi:hypothetical protein